MDSIESSRTPKRIAATKPEAAAGYRVLARSDRLGEKVNCSRQGRAGPESLCSRPNRSSHSTNHARAPTNVASAGQPKDIGAMADFRNLGIARAECLRYRLQGRAVFAEARSRHFSARSLAAQRGRAFAALLGRDHVPRAAHRRSARAGLRRRSHAGLDRDGADVRPLRQLLKQAARPGGGPLDASPRSGGLAATARSKTVRTATSVRTRCSSIAPGGSSSSFSVGAAIVGEACRIRSG